MATGNSIADRHFISRKISLIILGVTALVCSRLLFFLFNDPEGPNLLIVIGMALAIYSLSFVAYKYSPSRIIGLKRLLLAIAIQVLSVTAVYYWLR